MAPPSLGGSKDSLTYRVRLSFCIWNVQITPELLLVPFSCRWLGPTMAMALDCGRSGARPVRVPSVTGPMRGAVLSLQLRTDPGKGSDTQDHTAELGQNTQT